MIAGDSVDRGRDVFGCRGACMAWRFRRSRPAATSPDCSGTTSSTSLRGTFARQPRAFYAAEQMGGPARAFGADTVIGEWLRAQPVVAQFGRVLVTHGGSAPSRRPRG